MSLRIRFYVSIDSSGQMKERVLSVAKSLRDGARAFGDEVKFVHNGDFSTPGEDVDVACCWGIIGNSSEIVSAYLTAGKRVLMFDKALIRRLGNERQGHFRVGIDGPSPIKYLMRTQKSWERWESHRIEMKPRQMLEKRGTIVFCGSSQKYCDFYGLGDANDYAEGLFNQVRDKLCKADLIYRPKPSWPGFRQIQGTKHSGPTQNLLQLLKSAHVLITHGSAAAIEAIVSGVPAITLGPCAAHPVAGHSIAENIMDPFFVSDEARWQWACQLAWCQFTADELRSGEAWQFLKGELEATA
ncbi:MAG: hypothetical protein A3E78_11000 [Alphaproteobacteria bacterium RIFCSPHIGHO2_12_FULL_63_12]|nr:MAG: hypothetical protein A3E78_11000 [Alphaproteobacteria bacterium RIFCSPHIGHO2_12_FULL_63_12]